MKRLSAAELRRYCDPAQFQFDTTDDLATSDAPRGGFGQERALEAFRVGTGIEHDGYNLFVMGPPGTGKHSFVMERLRENASTRPAPADLCYVNNFAQPHRPKAMLLPAATGARIKKDVERLVDELRTGLSAAFESEEYRGSKKTIDDEVKARHDESFRALQKRAEDRGVKLIRTPEGLVFAPYREGKLLTPDEFKSMSEEKREQIQQDASAFHDLLNGFLQNIPDWEKSGRERKKELDRSVADATVRRLIEGLLGKYVGDVVPALREFLEEIRKDVLTNYTEFLRPQPDPIAGDLRFRKYDVNTLVENDASAGAPVVYEDNPTYQNLVGRVEYIAQMGALITDFSLIKPGALHRARGGYLVLDAYKLFLQPFAWDGLKRALRSREIRIESPGQIVSAISTISLDPEPFSQAPQVILIGERSLYYMLNRLDPDFPELFKVPVDFEEEFPWSRESSISYVAMIASMARKDGLRALSREAVARLIEEGARISGDAERLTARIELIADLVREANYWASEFRHDAIDVEDVQRAVDAQSRRNARLRDRILEETKRGTVLIETQGTRVGCVNGLAFVDQGNFSFGHPSRITAQVRLGRGDVVDIEREAHLGGPIHSKGVLILSGFLGGRYARDVPLSFAATLVFEQSYGIVEGDSASVAELCALLSAIAEIPIRQSYAVTGAVNQLGEVQAVGGVNQKIEGYFDLCLAKGLSGKQGVLIPEDNRKNLMLRRDVVEAAQSGAFHVIPVQHVDEAMEVLTGQAASIVNRRTEERLRALAERRREFGPSLKAA